MSYTMMLVISDDDEVLGFEDRTQAEEFAGIMGCDVKTVLVLDEADARDQILVAAANRRKDEAVDRYLSEH